MKPLRVLIGAVSGTPSANNTVIPGSNLLVGSNQSEPAQFEVWDGVGTGLSGLTDTFVTSPLYANVGVNLFPEMGATILGPGTPSVGVKPVPTEPGKFYAILEGYYETL